MHPKYNQTLQQVLAWAQTKPNIQGVLMIGSQARSTHPADEWSDLDLMVLADDPQALIRDPTWVNHFGKVVCIFDEIVPLHFTNWSWQVKRALYTDNRDVDFSILPYHQVDEVFSVNKEILSKGFRVLYDPNGGQLQEKVCALLDGAPPEAAPPLIENELRAVVSELLYHVIWAVKKLKRDELWVAVRCINAHMNDLLLQLVEAHNRSTAQRADTMLYGGRFLEQRTAAEVLAQLPHCCTHYERVDAIESLQQLLDITENLWQAICERNGFAYDAVPFKQVQAMYAEIKAAGSCTG